VAHSQLRGDEDGGGALSFSDGGRRRPRGQNRQAAEVDVVAQRWCTRPRARCLASSARSRDFEGWAVNVLQHSNYILVYKG
jgi:hypothetical protein